MSIETSEQNGHRYILGIDMGTTSVKIAVIDVDTLQLIEQRTHSDTDSNSKTAHSAFSSYYYHVNNNSRSEQYVAPLVESLDNCMLSLSDGVCEKIIGIRICGQMHGVVCWSSHHRPWTERRNTNRDVNFYDINSSRVSHHITWQDNRCDSQFISSLPRPDSHLTIHTGYGCCTLFWLNRYSPSTIDNYNRAGTIADFIVTMLCDEDRVQMSDQNAASWGYFNTQKREWNVNILKEANFPVRFLPEIVEPTRIAGHLKFSWHRIRKGTPVGVALGDLQSYIYAVLSDNDNNDNDIVDTNKRTAVINISTSAQLVFELQNFVPSDQEKTNAKIVPYFNGKYLHEAAALNGGNALSVYVTFLQRCLHTFGFELDREKIWHSLIEKSIQTNEYQHEHNLSFEPVFLGERYNPEQRANIYNITPDNFHTIEIFKALCRGLIENISKITSVEILKQNGIEKIVATGSALLRNPVLQNELEALFPLEINYRQSATSPFGAAMYTAQNTSKHLSEY